MECKHLDVAVDISPGFVRRLVEDNTNLWVCAECRSNKSPWMCLKCGMVLCGRYVSGHCKSHGESNPNHVVCIDGSLMVFCYKCDDYVINDTSEGTVQLIRSALQTELPKRQRKKRQQDQPINGGTPTKKKNSSKENIYPSSPQKLKTVGLRNLGNT